MSIFKRIIKSLSQKKQEPEEQVTPTVPPTFQPKMISIQMQDGTVEEYPEGFIITDGINCVVCLGGCYHTSLDCSNLRRERENCSIPVRGLNIEDAIKQKIYHCQNCADIYNRYCQGKLYDFDEDDF